LEVNYSVFKKIFLGSVISLFAQQIRAADLRSIGNPVRLFHKLTL